MHMNPFRYNTSGKDSNQEPEEEIWYFICLLLVNTEYSIPS